MNHTRRPVAPLGAIPEGATPDERAELAEAALDLFFGVHDARGRADALVRMEALRGEIEQRAKMVAAEPGNQRVVRFSHTFHGRRGALSYTFAAIRADNPRGERRWFITSADDLPGAGHRGIASPATWADLVAFAHAVEVANVNSGWSWVKTPAGAGGNQEDVRASLERNARLFFEGPHAYDEDSNTVSPPDVY